MITKTARKKYWIWDETECSLASIATMVWSVQVCYFSWEANACCSVHSVAAHSNDTLTFHAEHRKETDFPRWLFYESQFLHMTSSFKTIWCDGRAEWALSRNDGKTWVYESNASLVLMTGFLDPGRWDVVILIFRFEASGFFSSRLSHTSFIKDVRTERSGVRSKACYWHTQRSEETFSSLVGCMHYRNSVTEDTMFHASPPLDCFSGRHVLWSAQYSCSSVNSIWCRYFPLYRASWLHGQRHHLHRIYP